MRSVLVSTILPELDVSTRPLFLLALGTILFLSFIPASSQFLYFSTLFILKVSTPLNITLIPLRILSHLSLQNLEDKPHTH